jgi:hypothetical protein
MPQRIEDTLLVVAAFKDRGTEYLPGDRVPLRHRRIRQLAAERPEWFRMEYGTEELDLEWLAGLEADFEQNYEAANRAREAEKARQERAVRDELKAQDAPQPELERRFKRQEQEDAERKRKAREERERDLLEKQVALTGHLRDGFHNF